MDIKEFKLQQDYQIIITYINGEKRLFDMKNLLSEKPWDKLKSKTLFNKVTISYGTLSWPGEIDIAPETLFLKSIPLPRLVTK